MITLNRTSILKTLIIIPVVICFNLLTFISEYEQNLPLDYLLTISLFGETKLGDLRTFTIAVHRLYYVLIFNILFGTIIYRNFVVSSIYLFTRLKDRKKWLWKKSAELFLISLIYTFCFLFINLILCMYQTSKSIDGKTINTFLLLWITVSLFLLFTTLLINILSIRFNSHIGFIIVYIGLIILIGITLEYNTLRIFNTYPYLILLNPVSSILLNLSEDHMISIMGIVYSISINIMLICISSKYINKLDLAIITDEET